MPKILLSSSQYAGDGKSLCKQKKTIYPDWCFLLAAMTHSHWSAVCIEVVDDVPFDTDADLIGIGAMGHAVFRAMEIAAEFTSRQKCVMGGFMASMVPDKILEQGLDSVVVGDAEKSYPKTMRTLKRRTHRPCAIRQSQICPASGAALRTADAKPIGTMLPVRRAGCRTCARFARLLHLPGSLMTPRRRNSA
jgi:radical SAM superfamily enzyme YgiQ (UPF0313 family)